MESWLRGGNGNLMAGQCYQEYDLLSWVPIEQGAMTNSNGPEEGKDDGKSFSNCNLKRAMKNIRLFRLETKGFVLEEWDEVLSNKWKSVLKKDQTYFVWLRRAATLVQVKSDGF